MTARRNRRALAELLGRIKVVTSDFLPADSFGYLMTPSPIRAPVLVVPTANADNAIRHWVEYLNDIRFR
jgi:hypothetical protein